MSKDKDDFDETRAAVEATCLESEARELVTEVEDVATKVYEALGGGRDEDVYQQAMAIEFRRRNISFRTKAPIEVLYEEERVGFARPDFMVDGRLVVELKRDIPWKDGSLSAQIKKNIAQTKAYMRTLGLWNGLVVNFPPNGEPRPQFKRVVNDAVSTDERYVKREVPVEGLQLVKPLYEKKYGVPISQKMRKATEEVSSVWADFKRVEAEYGEMLSQARKFGFSEDEIEASDSLNWRRVKP